MRQEYVANDIDRPNRHQAEGEAEEEGGKEGAAAIDE